MATDAANNFAENLASLASQTTAPTVDIAIITASPAIPTGNMVQIIPSNQNRKGMIIYNNSGNSIYIRYGSMGTSATCTTIIASFAQWVMPAPYYRGPLFACRNAGAGSAIITELE